MEIEAGFSAPKKRLVPSAVEEAFRAPPNEETTMGIDKELLKTLVCPKCKGELEYREEKEFVCHSCRLVYAVDEGIPNFLIDEAQPLQDPGE